MEDQFTKIVKGYTEYVASHRKRPPSIAVFMSGIDLTEADFYAHAADFKSLERKIWLELANTTVSKVKSEEVYLEYNSRERLLSFYFTLIENLKEHREFYQVSYNKPTAILPPQVATDFVQLFDSFIQDLIHYGTETGEIDRRQFIDRAYPSLFRTQLHFLIKYFLEDRSQNFEATDEAVERSVNLSYDLLGHNFVDEFFSFGKFLFENKKSKH